MLASPTNSSSNGLNDKLQVNPVSDLNNQYEVDGVEYLDNFLAQCSTKEYRRHAVVVRQGEQTNKLYFLLKGSVSVVRQHENDKDIVLAYLNQGSFFGEMGLFDENRVRSATIRTRTVCQIAEISYEKFEALTAKHPDILMAISKQLTARLRKTSKKVVDLAFLDVTGRVAACLLDLINQPDAITHPDGIMLKITRQELSRHVGCTREMVGKVLKSLEEQGLVSFEGHSIVVIK